MVNVNKLKPYRVLDSDALASLPGPTASKTTIKTMTIDNEDELTGQSKKASVDVARVDGSKPSQPPPPFLFPPIIGVTSRLKWHQTPLGQIFTIMAEPLPPSFSSQFSFLPSTHESDAVAIAISVLREHFSFQQRVERPISAQWRKRLHNNSSPTSQEHERQHQPTPASEQHPPSLGQAQPAPSPAGEHCTPLLGQAEPSTAFKSSAPTHASPTCVFVCVCSLTLAQRMVRRKSTNPNARRTMSKSPANRTTPINTKDELYRTFHFMPLELLQVWRAYMEKHPEEKKFVKDIGVKEYLALDWNNQEKAPRMALIEEFINAAVLTDEAITARVRSKEITITANFVSEKLHLPFGAADMETIPPAEFPPDRLKEYMIVPKTDEGYKISDCLVKHHPRLAGLTQGLGFKRKPNYIGDHGFHIMCISEALIARDLQYSWATHMFDAIMQDVKKM